MKNNIFPLLTISILLGLSSCSNPSDNGASIADRTRNIGDDGTGNLILKDDNGFVYAEGVAKNNVRNGAWKFYISPSSRANHTPDVVGSYDELGNKNGDWVHSNTKTGINIKAHYHNGIMEGECVYYDQNNALLARGLVANGIRHGKWILYDENSGSTGGYHPDGYKQNVKMTEGYYKNGLRLGNWEYDYYLDKNTHVKGQLTFEKGVNTGRFEFYKIERHEKFGTEEMLSGIGTFSSNIKTGRWVVFNYGTKGDFIETGDYNSEGKRDGLWKVRIGDQTHLAGNYDNGVPHGASKQYYENGTVKYETIFNHGLEEGSFVSYYKNGQVMEQGTHIVVNGETTRDTAFFTLRLPYEHHFLLVEEDFQDLNYDYITWLEQPGYSIDPTELTRRFELFKTYGQEANRRIDDVKIINKKVMREGQFLAFYQDGSLRLKGENTPGITSLFDPFEHSITQGFARSGEWKEYGQNKLLKGTFIYENGKLTKMLDGNGHVEHTIKYEPNGSVSMVDKDGGEEYYGK
jgi:antitoxin component YwqK of YwqJK toxin-antitoxin module